MIMLRNIVWLAFGTFLTVIALGSVASASPDLIVQSVSLDPVNAEVDHGTVRIVFKNIGPDKAKTGLLDRINYTVKLNGSECDSGTINDLKAGDTNSESTNSCQASTPGAHTITVEIDSDYDVSESNEGNNIKTVSLSWGGADLVITGLTLSPGTPLIEEGTLQATIKNQGSYGTGLVNIDVKFFLDGLECDTGILYAGLGEGNSATENSTACNPTTPGAHTIKVQVDYTGDVPEENEGNNFYQKSFTWQGGPDLIITGITLNPTKPDVGKGTLTATIKNQGQTGTGLVNINLKMYLDGTQCATGIIYAGLGDGNTATEQTGACNPDTPGVHTIRFEVDTDHDVAESNEANNSFQKTFIWGGADLVVTGLVLEPTVPLIGEGKLIATIENQGSYGTGLVNIDVKFFLDGVECDTGILYAGLGDGNDATEQSTSCNPTEPGAHTIRVQVDYTGEVPEEDESNNVFDKQFTWDGGADLVITGATISPDPPKVDDGRITATITNQGVTGTGLLVNINLVMYLDGEQCDTGLIIGGLGQGNSATERTSKCNPTTPGEHLFRIEVDTDDDVDEQDESNNAYETTFNWVAPDLLITQIVSDPAQLELGGDAKFTATIENQGPIGTGIGVNINLRMFLDGQECDDGIIYAGLGAGNTATEKTTKCKPSTGGVHVMRFDVDTDEDVIESDEANNSFEQAFVWCTDTELCNGLDDDCDGSTDEGFILGAACDGADADQCATGLTVCDGAGTGTICEELGAAKVEACDGIDNDCDGSTDEEWPELGGACSPGGLCGMGQWACDDAGGVTCEATGVSESCDGVDNDCDGSTDEDWPELGAACAVGDGACRAMGAWVCGSGGTECDAQAGDPAAEICGDGVDNDCDGLVDQGCPCEAGTYLVCGTDVGACNTGALTCAGGVFGASCAGANWPVTETCGDGVDNDCDGSVDEGCACSGGPIPCAANSGVCATGEAACTEGVRGPCVSAALADESCDGVDNDCDGAADDGCPCNDGATQSCAVTPDDCADYARVCVEGAWSACAAVPGSEIGDCGPGSGDSSDGDTGSGADAAGGPDVAGGDDIARSDDTAGGSAPVDALGDDGCDQGGGPAGLPLSVAMGLGSLWLWLASRRHRAA